MAEGRIRTSIGKFDFLKGVAIVCVIFSHSLLSYDFKEYPVINFICAGVFFPTFYGIFLSFFVISGYYYRERPVTVALRSEVKLIWKPYVLTFLGVLLFRSLYLWLTSAYSIQDSLSLFLSFLLGTISPVKIFGVTTSSIGYVWFLLGNFWCLVILGILVKHIAPKWRIPVMTITFTACMFLSSRSIFPFYCIREGFNYLPLCFYGYIFRKKKILQKLTKKWLLICFGSVVFLTALFISIFGLGSYYVTIGLASLWSLFFFILAFYSTPRPGIITDAISFLGRYSLYILCFHNIEHMAFPGLIGRITGNWALHPFVEACLFFFFRSAIIAAGCGLFFFAKKLLQKCER